MTHHVLSRTLLIALTALTLIGCGGDDANLSADSSNTNISLDASSLVATREGNQGCTIGYWKQTQHFDSWAYSINPHTGTAYTPSDIVSGPFPQLTTHFPSLANLTFLEALNLSGGPGALGGAKILLKQAIAALLNGGSTIILNNTFPPRVEFFANAAIATDDRDTMINLATQLEAANNGADGCPLN